MQCWVGTRIQEWWPMVPTQKNCTLGHRRRAPKSTFCCPPSIGRLRAHFDGNLFCRTTKQSEDRTRECNRATHRTTWGKWGGEGGVVRGLFFEKSVRFCQVKRRFKKKRHFKKEKRIFGWREQRWGHTAKARDLPHFSATSVGGRTQSTAKEKGKDTKRGQTQTQVVL